MRWVYTVLIALVGLFLLLVSLGIAIQLGDARRLWSEGAVAEGTVTNMLRARKGNSWFYSYRFSAGGSVQERERRDIPWGAQDIPIGSKVPVRYDPKDPRKSITRAELDELEAWGNRFVFPAIGVALLGWAFVRVFRRSAA